jgi:hypothetical protein
LSFIALALAVLVSPWGQGVARGADEPPQLIYSKRKGLNISGNKIDQLIHLYGFVCFHNPHNRRPCRIEQEIIKYIHALPPNIDTIARDLASLGAICELQKSVLICLFLRNVQNEAWTVGAVNPTSIIDESLRIELKITREGHRLHVGASYTRTSKKLR